MKRQSAAFASVVCATILVATSIAFAGTYGDTVEAEESPTAVSTPPAPPEPQPSGYYYLGAAAIYSIENFDDGADNAWGYNLRLGRRISDMYAAELEFEHPVQNFKDISGEDGNGNLRGDVEAWNLTLNGRVYPLTGHVQPYALVGLGYGRAELPADDNDGFIARFGVGVDFLITQNFGIEAEAGYVLGAGSISLYDQIPFALGIFYNFI